MRIAVCYNIVAAPVRGEPHDGVADQKTVEEAEEVAQALAELGASACAGAIRRRCRRIPQATHHGRRALLFNLCEGLRGDSHLKLHASAVLELTGLPMTGSNPFTLGLTQDKLRTKEVLEANGLTTPRYLLAPRSGPPPTRHSLGYPLIVKPRSEDASHGISEASVVEDAAGLAQRVERSTSRPRRADAARACSVRRLLAGRL